VRCQVGYPASIIEGCADRHELEVVWDKEVKVILDNEHFRSTVRFVPFLGTSINRIGPDYLVGPSMNLVKASLPVRAVGIMERCIGTPLHLLPCVDFLSARRIQFVDATGAQSDSQGVPEGLQGSSPASKFLEKVIRCMHH